MPDHRRGEISKEAVLGVAMTVALCMASLRVPLFGTFFFLLVPLPILYFRAKLGKVQGALIPAASTVVLFLILGGGSLDLLLFLALMVLGFTLAGRLETNSSVEKTVLYASGAPVAILLAGLIVYGNLSEAGIRGMVSDYVQQNIDLTMAMYRSGGISEENVKMLEKSLKSIQYVLERTLPALAVASSLFVTWVTLLLGRPLLASRGLPCGTFGAMNRWKASDYMVWPVLASGLMLMLPAEPLRLFGMNSLIILLTFYFFQGMAIVSFHFERRGFPTALRVFLYCLIVLQPIVLLLVVGLGFFDVWLNTRRL